MKSTSFNTHIIERRQTITLGTTLDVTGTFQKQIYLNFIPDELKVVNITYVSAGEVGASILYSNLVSDSFGAFQNSDVTNQVNVFFLLQKPISGMYTFQILDVNGNLVTTRAGNLFLQLEFIKYKDLPQEKIY